MGSCPQEGRRIAVAATKPKQGLPVPLGIGQPYRTTGSLDSELFGKQKEGVMASVGKRPNGKWRARYRDDEGKEHARHFSTKREAQAWLDGVTADMVAGTYVDPKHGKVSFSQYAEEWRSMQVHRASTASQVKTNMTRHVYPALGQHPIGSIKRSQVQALVKGLSLHLAPATVEVVYRYVVSVFNAAQADRLIKHSPCVGVKLPPKAKPKVEPFTTETVKRFIDSVPDRYRALLILGAGTGLRSGEARGLTVDRVNFFRRTVRVDRQLVQNHGGEFDFGPTKTESSNRTVPLPTVVVDALVAHMAKYPPSEDGVVFTDDLGRPIARNRFSEMWRPIAAVQGLEGATGFHDLRHFYASLLIHHGESVKVVQDRLGHKTAIETLDTYGHLWPNSEDSTRQAVDDVLGVDDEGDDGVEGVLS